LFLFYDSGGNLYFVTAPTGGGQVRKVSADGTIHFVAGNGQTAFSGDGGPALSAGMGQIIGIGEDSGGNLYILDVGDQRLRKVTPRGTISTIAGNGSPGFSPDGTQATLASLNLGGAGGIAIDSSGRILFTDNNRVRAIASNGALTTVVGTGAYSFSGDGGPPLAAALGPAGMVFDPYGNLLIADPLNTRIREVFATPAPIIASSQTGLTFTTAAGVAPQPQTITIFNAALGVLNFGLTVSPSSA
jgi:trimeric autotransporter adhesin